MSKLGELRRSSVIQNMGPGAIVDFRTQGANGGPVSAVMTGLEDWDRMAPPKGLQNNQVIHEERLQKALAVSGFRLPPVSGDEKDPASVGAVRFPLWFQCPQCNSLGPFNKWESRPGEAALFCPACQNGRKRVPVIPVRFVLSCSKGHLDDFPWNFWVGHKDGCSKRNLKLETRGAGLSGLYVHCVECGESKSLGGIMSEATMKNMNVKCKGKRHWLGDSEECELTPRVIQRGASNMYFPITQSALSIPPWSDRLQSVIGRHWNDFVNLDDESFREQYIRKILIPALIRDGVFDSLNLGEEEFVSQLISRAEMRESINSSTLRKEEYQQLVTPLEESEEGAEFMTRFETVPDSISPWVSNLVRVVRLREVRALRGFTRIKAPGVELGGDGNEDVSIAPLSRQKLPWLPAIEVRGEGIFLELRKDRVEAWEKLPAVQERVERIRKHAASLGDANAVARLASTGPRMFLVHSLSHALIRQLTLECGYSSASLRERLYVQKQDGDDAGMCGLLIYTATADADGTLGGLERQGKGERFSKVLVGSIRAQEWCSSDPLCIEETNSVVTPLNPACCHSCLLVAETSCEEFNVYLDRACLVGTPESQEIGFFTGMEKY